MKKMNLKTKRKLYSIVAMFSLVAVLVSGVQSFPVLAAEIPTVIECDTEHSATNMNVQTFEFVVGPENSTRATNSTTYFINDSEFTFQGTNLGYEFYVPRRCNCRMLVAVVADDGANENITIKLKYSGGSTTHTRSVATNNAAVYVLNDVGAGGHNLEYSGRSNMRYHVRISLYTWDY